MLFGRGLIKLLFATETFAMGVNASPHTTQPHRRSSIHYDPTLTVLLLCYHSVPMWVRVRR